MKSPSHRLPPPARHALCAATVAFLFGTAAVLAQEPAPGTTPATGSTSNAAVNADNQATAEINAQTKTGAGAMTGRETKADKLSWTDRHFVNKAADEGQEEIACAQLAAERASNPEVKSFAQKLVDDHTKVNAELKEIASRKNVKLDDDNDHDRTYKRLTKKTGIEFDRLFVEHMVDGHESAIKTFEKAAKNAKDADLRSFASKHLDHLREHLQSAQSLRQSVIPTGRTDESSDSSATKSSDSPIITPPNN